MKKAIVVASFGTSYQEATERCIEPIEFALQETFPDWTIVRAFTSSMIRNKLNRQKAGSVLSPEEQVRALIDQGYQEIFVQPTLLLAGVEYDKMQRALSKVENDFPQVKIQLGDPLFAKEGDEKAVATILMEAFPASSEGMATIFFGHGTDHVENERYLTFQQDLTQLNARAYIANVEADPTLDSVMHELKRQRVTEVQVVPLMLVAGDHVQNDMAGEEENSWTNRLKANQFNVTAHICGMGQNDAIVARYIRKAKEKVAG